MTLGVSVTRLEVPLFIKSPSLENPSFHDPLQELLTLVDKLSPILPSPVTAQGLKYQCKAFSVCLVLMPIIWCCYVHLYLPLTSQLVGQLLECREPSLYLKVSPLTHNKGSINWKRQRGRGRRHSFNTPSKSSPYWLSVVRTTFHLYGRGWSYLDALAGSPPVHELEPLVGSLPQTSHGALSWSCLH